MGSGAAQMAYYPRRFLSMVRAKCYAGLAGNLRSGDRTCYAPRLNCRSAVPYCWDLPSPALAGPPYMTDDPEPTDYQHFEIYTFSQGTATQGGVGGEGGIDFNYGGAPNLQLTATLPATYNFPASGSSAVGPGNVELAAKYRFLTQDNFGLDVAVFPRVFLPSASPIGRRAARILSVSGLDRERLAAMVRVRRRRLRNQSGRRLARLLPRGSRCDPSSLAQFTGGPGIVPSDRRIRKAANKPRHPSGPE